MSTEPRPVTAGQSKYKYEGLISWWCERLRFRKGRTHFKLAESRRRIDVEPGAQHHSRNIWTGDLNVTENKQQQTFTIASDERLIAMIGSARDRLLVVAPGLSRSVAEALVSRVKDETLSIHVVLDADAEVYRLGYGDSAALELLRKAMVDNGLALAMQPGLRIGMVVCDECMIVYAPVPQLIEAGSEVETKPNAILLGGGDALEMAVAAVSGSKAESEIGNRGLAPADIIEIEKDLAANPPQKFQIARAVQVFSSRAEFVELEIDNLRLTSRRMPLPPELLAVSDVSLKNRITAAIQPPPEIWGPFELEVEQDDGSMKSIAVDQGWISKQRTELERYFTYSVPNHGRVILIREKENFEASVQRFQHNIQRYHKAISSAIFERRAAFKESLVNEYLPHWLKKPPVRVTRYDPSPQPAQIKFRLEELLDDMLDQAFTFDPISYRLIYKGITWTSATDEKFGKSLKDAMARQDVPREVREELFDVFNAARAAQIDAPEQTLAPPDLDRLI